MDFQKKTVPNKQLNPEGSRTTSQPQPRKTLTNFTQQYRQHSCLSFDYGLSSDFGPEDIDDFLHCLVTSSSRHQLFETFYVGCYNPATTRLLQQCSPTIKELRIAHWDYRSFFPESEIRAQPKFDLKNLQRLHVKLVMDDNMDEGSVAFDSKTLKMIKGFFQFVTRIKTKFSHFPSV